MKASLDWVLFLLWTIVCFPSSAVSSKRCYYSDGQIRGYCHDQTFSEPGHVRFAAVVGIHEPRDGHYCGDISPSGVQTAMAVKWIVDILNGAGTFPNAFVPGIKLGFDVYDDCGLVSRATDGVLELVPITDSKIAMTCTAQCDVKQPPFLGLVSSSTPEATSSTLSVLPPAITGVTSQSSYMEKSDRRQTFTTSEEEEVEGIVKLMEHLKWSMVAVVYTDDQRGMKMYSALREHSKRSGICLTYTSVIKERDMSKSSEKDQLEPIIENLENKQKKLTQEKLGVVFLANTKTAKTLFQYVIDRETNVIVHKLQWVLPSNIHLDHNFKSILAQPSAPKVIFVEKHHRLLTPFKEFFVNELTNSAKYSEPVKSYLDQYEMQMLGRTDARRDELLGVFRQAESVFPTVTAIMMIAASLRKIQRDLCNVQTNLCQDLHTNLTDDMLRLDSSYFQEIDSSSAFPDDLKNLTLTNDSFSFSFKNLHDLRFSIFEPSDQTLQVLASLETGELVIHDRSTLEDLTSECKSTCEDCWSTEDVKFAFIPGDVLLLGIFSLREDGSTSSTDSANKYNCGAFRDSYAPLTVSAFLHSIQNFKQRNLAGVTVGGIALDDCYNPLSISYLLSELFTGKRSLLDPDTGEKIDFSKVIAVIGALSSKVTQIIADQLTSLDIPLVSYGASSASLDDRIRYPLFLRTVPSDDFQVQGLVDLLEKLKFSHVGVIYLDDAYGRNAKQSFLTMTEYKNICIEEPLPITEDFTSEQIQNMIDKLIEQRVKVVLYIGIDTVSEKLLENLQSMTATNHFTFVASEGWGTNTRILAGDKGKAAAGTLVFVTNNSFYMDDSFKRYLENITSSSKSQNPWLNHFWEMALECDFPGSFNKRYTKSCSSETHFSQSQVENFSSAQRGVHVHHAVFAIDKAYLQVMNDPLCQPFRRRECANKFVTAIKSTELIASNGQRIKVFKDDGNGFMGFTVYNIQPEGQDAYNYVKVGSYSSTNSEKLMLNISNILTYKEGSPPIRVNMNELGATCESARSSRAHCLSVCPYTSTVPPSTPAPTTATLGPQTPDNSSLLNIVLAVLCGVFLIVLIFLAVMMCRQQRITNAFQQKAITIPSPEENSFEIYDEPYKEKRNRTTSFEQNEHINSSTSGVISMKSGHSSSRNFSNGTTHSVKTPIKYSDLLQVEVPTIDTLKYGSRASVATYLDPANSDIPKIQITRDDSTLQNSGEGVSEEFQRTRSADDLQDSDPKLNYIQAKDLDIEDEDEFVEQDSDLNYPNRAVSLNDNIMRGQPTFFSQRPNTLPGIPSRSEPVDPGLMNTPSYSAPVPPTHLSPMYLDAIHDSQVIDPSGYPSIPVHIQGHPNSTQLLMVSPGAYVPSVGYQGIPSSRYQQVYIPTIPHSNIGYHIPANITDIQRPRVSSFSAGVPQPSIVPQTYFPQEFQRTDTPQGVDNFAFQNTGQNEFVSSTLPVYRNKSKEQREHYHSMTSMPDVISHENDDGAEIMI